MAHQHTVLGRHRIFRPIQLHLLFAGTSLQASILRLSDPWGRQTECIAQASSSPLQGVDGIFDPAQQKASSSARDAAHRSPSSGPSTSKAGASGKPSAAAKQPKGGGSIPSSSRAKTPALPPVSLEAARWGLADLQQLTSDSEFAPYLLSRHAVPLAPATTSPTSASHSSPASPSLEQPETTSSADTTPLSPAAAPATAAAAIAAAATVSAHNVEVCRSVAVELKRQLAAAGHRLGPGDVRFLLPRHLRRDEPKRTVLGLLMRELQAAGLRVENAVAHTWRPLRISG